MHSKGIVGAVSMKELHGQNIGLFIILRQARRCYTEVSKQLEKNKLKFHKINTLAGDEGDKSKGEERILKQVAISKSLCERLERMKSFINFASSAEYTGRCRNKACDNDILLARILGSDFSPLCTKCAQ